VVYQRSSDKMKDVSKSNYVYYSKRYVEHHRAQGLVGEMIYWALVK